jgi:DNA-binding transcriptional ArsR family regulator
MKANAPVGLFGSATRTSTLLVIRLLGETHASEVAAVLGKSLSRIQGALSSLERAGIIVGAEEGKARRIRLNPRYPALEELGGLLDKLGMLDVPLQQKLAEKRRRPRRSGKAL